MDTSNKKTIQNFIESSNTFNGFVFNGCYTMPREIFFNLFNIYHHTGENYLDIYTKVTHLIWDMHIQEKENDIKWYYKFEEINDLEECLSISRKYKLFDQDTLSDCRNYLKRKYRERAAYLERLINEPRNQANKFIAKKEIREEVFKIYGKKCLCCGSTKNITIDHVMPVFKGGIDHIDNLQPLCKSCNSKKNSKFKDYRHG